MRYKRRLVSGAWQGSLNVFAAYKSAQRVMKGMGIAMLDYEVWIASVGVCRFAFDWRYDCDTAVVPLVYTSLREYAIVRAAPNGIRPVATELDDILYAAGVEHFDFTGSRARIISDTRAALEAIAKIKLCAILDGETSAIGPELQEQLRLQFAPTEHDL